MKFVFIVIISVLAASCSGTKPATGVNNSNSPASPAEKPKSAYPPVSSVIMKAENRNLDGSPLKLEDLKGKVVLLNLWATWCGPCREEIPHLVELQDKYRDKGFEVVGLDVDPEAKEDIEKFMAEMKINYTIGWAHEDLSNEIVRLNRMGGIPQSILINREGQLTGVFLGGGDRVIAKMKETVTKIVGE